MFINLVDSVSPAGVPLKGGMGLEFTMFVCFSISYFDQKLGLLAVYRAHIIVGFLILAILNLDRAAPESAQDAKLRISHF